MDLRIKNTFGNKSANFFIQIGKSRMILFIPINGLPAPNNYENLLESRNFGISPGYFGRGSIPKKSVNFRDPDQRPPN